jgi:hypothetical protein
MRLLPHMKNQFRCRAPAALCFVFSLAGCEPQTPPDPPCTDPQRIATLPSQLREASGLALSRRDADVLWVHNDSHGTPTLFALRPDGSLLAEIELPDAGTQYDWEAIASGPCPAGDCLYIGDIGDNLHDRQDRAILRMPEPEPRSGVVQGIERFPIRYPDGPRDAEALFVLPDTSIFIISKGRSGPVTVYRYPLPLRAERVTLEVVQQLTPGLVQLPDLVTGAAATPGGEAIVIRTYTHLQLYRPEGDTLGAVWPGRGFDLAALVEPQGEGVAVTPDGTVYLVSESGPNRLPPPFSSLRCRLD